ncbi:DUF6279 family lipoprotein [Pleionea mediterranea]|uniref:Lipoprotein n=1 Tax=Pleionea mediterranea TaxID=523701 RepID=A0A316FSU0_9GAMM|nr:DUF6279 family lipoprotein [Pleionea mediterranea]PWK51828.1 hypothetical protein C8D97_105143 [Pleionea mediterranea]
MRCKHWLTLIAAVLLLQGCSIKFWYNRLDWVVPWYVDDYVELSGQQEEQLEKLMLLKTEWHRENELPRYIAWLDSLDKDIRNKQVEQRYDFHRQQLSNFYQNLVDELAGDFASLMVQLSDQQVNELFIELEQMDQETLEEFNELSAEELFEQKDENIADGVSEWIGRLSNEQKMIVTEWASQVQSTTLERMAYRKRWREAMREALKTRQQEQGANSIQSVMVNAQSLQGDVLKAMYQNNRELTQHYLIRIYDTLSDKQLKRLLAKISDYKEDFTDLMDDD